VARAAAALGACAVFVAHLFVLASVVRAQARDLLRPELRGEAVDVIVSPQPAESLCWSVIVVEKDEANGTINLHRGTLSLLPSRRPASSCTFHRLWDLPSVPWPAERRLARGEPIRVRLDRLRDHASRDCRVNAWMQFGRAPFFRGDEIRDLRFETGPRENFTAMSILDGGRCPSNVTSWGLPRVDLLQ
jgi:inner membrane protein